MKKITILGLVLGLLLTTYSQEYIEISDTAFERYLFDSGHDDIIDGYILKSTALSIGTLSIGLEYKITDKDILTEFPNITELSIKTNTLVKLNLDLAKNITRLSLSNYGGRELDLYLDTLRGYNYISGENNVVKLYCNATKKLGGYFYNVNFMNIDELLFSAGYTDNILKKTNLKKATIKHIYRDTHNAHIIEIENNPNLEHVDINNGIHYVMGFNISNNEKLKSITLDNMIPGTFERFNIIENTTLENIIIIDSVTNLRIQNNELDTLIIKGSNTLDFNTIVNEIYLKALYIDGFKDVNLDLSGNFSLTKAVVSNAESISGLDLSENGFLTCLNLEGCTNMSNINLDNCHSLSCVQVESNYIPIFPHKISSQESVGSYAVTDECSDCDFTIPSIGLSDILVMDTTLYKVSNENLITTTYYDSTVIYQKQDATGDSTVEYYTTITYGGESYSDTTYISVEDTLNITLTISSGLDEFEDELKVWSDGLSIYFESTTQEGYSFELVSISGTTVLEVDDTYTTNQVSLSGIATGTYIAKFQSLSYSSVTTTKKIVIR